MIIGNGDSVPKRRMALPSPVPAFHFSLGTGQQAIREAAAEDPICQASAEDFFRKTLSAAPIS